MNHLLSPILFIKLAGNNTAAVLFLFLALLSGIVDFHSGDMLSAGQIVEPPRRHRGLFVQLQRLAPRGRFGPEFESKNDFPSWSSSAWLRYARIKGD